MATSGEHAEYCGVESEELVRIVPPPAAGQEPHVAFVLTYSETWLASGLEHVAREQHETDAIGSMPNVQKQPRCRAACQAVGEGPLPCPRDGERCLERSVMTAGGKVTRGGDKFPRAESTQIESRRQVAPSSQRPQLQSHTSLSST